MLKQINLYVIEMPLKSPFYTHLEVVTNRKGIIVEAISENGVKGYGETVAFSTPWYTEETVQTSLHMLKDVIIPLMKKEKASTPERLSSVFEKIRGNHMAKAGIETALWDLEAKENGEPLWKWIGGVRREVKAGVVVAADSVEEAEQQIEEYLNEGYERVKIKISPGKDLSIIKQIKERFPDLPLMADANSAYSLEEVDAIKALDPFGLMMIEQPLAVDDLVDHSILQKQIQTPICLDESISTYHDAESAIKLGSCQVINIKIGRVGGIQSAKSIHDLCLANGIDVWCGGMIEFGISRAHNIALSTLEGFTIPGDLSSSSRFWEEDIIEPQIEVKNGRIQAPMKSGIGFEINERRLKEVTIHKEEIKW